MESKNYDLNSLKIDRSTRNNVPLYRKKGFVYSAVIVVVLFLLVILFIKPFSDEVEVKATSASRLDQSRSSAVLTASGYVVAQRKASVASKGMGRITELNVVEGDEVNKDQIIARLEDSDIKAQLEQAKANYKLSQADLKESETNFERQRKLFETNSTTKMELDAAETRLLRVKANIEVAAAVIKNAEVALENTLIRAPFRGKVLTKNADIGEVVAPLAGSIGSRGAVVTIADMSSLQVEADVSESNIQKIKINQECEITLDAYQNIKYPAYVSKVVPTADRGKATVQVKIGFRNYDEKVLPEMSAKVVFLGEKEKDAAAAGTPKLVIPSSAVKTLGDRKVVYRIVDNKAVETEIKTGESFGYYVEVLSGLNDYERIIETADEKIKNGTSIKLL